MFNTYLLPISDERGCYIMKAYANDMPSAEDRFVQDIIETYEIDENVNSLEEIETYFNENTIDIKIGDIYDLEEF